jgi:hypothetical protein
MSLTKTEYDAERDFLSRKIAYQRWILANRDHQMNCNEKRVQEAIAARDAFLKELANAEGEITSLYSLIQKLDTRWADELVDRERKSREKARQNAHAKPREERFCGFTREQLLKLEKAGVLKVEEVIAQARATNQVTH